MSTIKVDTIKDTNNVEVYTCKAWVNFNGTGTVAIRASGNVSSITDNGTGDYTVNFTTAMPDNDYCVSVFSGNDGSTSVARTATTAASFGTSSVRIKTVLGRNDGTELVDESVTNVVIFR